MTEPLANREGEAIAALRTFLIADVRGYTRFTQEHGDEEGATLARRFAVLARCGITDHGGELVELRGDEALGAFGSARDALRAAIELQRLFRTSSEAGPALPLGVGIGVDAGEAVPVESGYAAARSTSLPVSAAVREAERSSPARPSSRSRASWAASASSIAAPSASRVWTTPCGSSRSFC